MSQICATHRAPARRVPLRRTPLLVLGDGLLLLCALPGTVFCLVTAFQIPVDQEALLVSCLLCGLAALALFSLPRGRHCLLALAILLPLAALVLWRYWDILSLGEVFTRCTVVNRFAQDFSSLSRIYPVDQLPEVGWIWVTTRFFMAVAAGLAVLLGWAVCRVRSFWLVFWLTFPTLVPPLCITVTPDWIPLMALFACWGTMLLTSLAARRDPQGGARLTLIALPAAGLLLALMTLALPMEGYRQPRWAARAQVDLMNWGNDLARQLSLSGGLLPGPFSGFTAAGASESVDLSAAGPLHYSGRTMLRVQTQVQGKLYLRGYAAAQYTGTSWEPLEAEAYDDLFPADDSEGPLGNYQPLNFPAMTAGDADYHPITIEQLGGLAGCVYTPYQLVTTPEQVRGAQFSDDAYLARDTSVRKHTVYFRQDPLDTGTYEGLTGAAARAEQAYQRFVDSYYTAVPEAAWQAMDEWHLRVLEEFPDTFTLPLELDDVPEQLREVAIIEQICRYALEQTTRYDPDTPVLPEGEDFLDYFLNESGRGYCMHYATFATLFFRSSGYPARYVSGYVTHVPGSGRVDVPDSSAHAWTEVYINGYGWYPVDLTPGYEGDSLPGVEATPEPTATPEPSASPSDDPSPSATPSAAPSQAPAPSEAPLTGNGAPASPLWWLLLPGALLLALAGLVVRRLLARRRRSIQLAQADPNRAAVAAYVWLQALMSFGAQCPEWVHDLAQKAHFSQHILTRQERDALVAYVQSQARQLDYCLPFPRRLVFRYLKALY